jgi:hypothetical protein
MTKSMKFKRTVAHLEAMIKAYNSAGARFDVVHSAYSTAINFPETKQSIKFTTFNYRDKVFAASRAIIKDLESNPLAHEIVKMQWQLNNFDSRNGWNTNHCKAVINIDISKAYATCLLNSGLISQKTFDFLNELKKHERLPAVGMIAKRAVLYRYNAGECVSFEQINAKWTNIFFYVVNQINEIMKDCEAIAGEHFCFYWVDGIFLDHGIDKQTLQELENYLWDSGFKFKYEKVENFHAWREEEKIFVNMVKNGEAKSYCYRDPNFARNYRTLLESLSNERQGNEEESAPDSVQLWNPEDNGN